MKCGNNCNSACPPSLISGTCSGGSKAGARARNIAILSLIARLRGFFSEKKYVPIGDLTDRLVPPRKCSAPGLFCFVLRTCLSCYVFCYVMLCLLRWQTLGVGSCGTLETYAHSGFVNNRTALLTRPLNCFHFYCV